MRDILVLYYSHRGTTRILCQALGRRRAIALKLAL
jgi:flavodoxin